MKILVSAVSQNQPLKVEIKGFKTGRFGCRQKRWSEEPLAEVIPAKVEVGLTAQRIYQDLVEEGAFSDSLSLLPAKATAF